MRIAIDARPATETAAGRGRYVRELLRHMAAINGDWEIGLFAPRIWRTAELDADRRFSWQATRGHPMVWPLLVAARLRGRFDVVLATSSYALAAAAPVAPAAVVWDFAPFDRAYGAPAGSGFERVTAPVAVRRARRLVAISEATGQALASRFPAAAPKTAVVTPAADGAFSPRSERADAAVRARHRLPDRYVLAVGTLEPRKNLVRLIEAFAQLPPAVRGDHQLVLVGATGWHVDSTFAAVARHSSLVRTLGFVADADLPAIYRGATVFAYPSLYEGFGIPVLEALQTAVPVLTSSTSSLPEVAGSAAIYVDPVDVPQIRSGLANLLNDVTLRARLAADGPIQASRFSWARSAERMLGILEDLAAV